MTPRCLYLGGDIICHLAFGYPLDTQTSPTNRPFLAAMSTINARISLYMNWPATSIVLNPLIKWLDRKRAAYFRKSIQTMIRTRMAMDKDAKHDLYSMALSGKAGEGNVESDEGVRGTNEIRTTFSSGRDIRNGPQLKSCEYLRAVIDETLRIATSSLGTLWRQQDMSSPATAGKPFIVDGQVIPPGTAAGISPYSLLHNGAYFPKPFTFQPELWLAPKDGSDTPEKQEARAIMRRAHAPFALGDRGCAGKAMAYLEISLMLARHMVLRF
ncbi:putative cytochrome P450 12c1, mitochondrial [Cytospora mali]|uniref:Cytochrome P450 12c1, mitochondrial n=1 Tax=Cytospora mali TaxID=578113 RepID=A0A194W066_CYTMA|nr:putative cytochrome P450 12c1, mitochondrial [Valsa mali]